MLVQPELRANSSCRAPSSWLRVAACCPALPLAQVAITFKNQQVLRDISWEVKKGERVGLVGVNGAGKTTQLQVGGEWW